MDLHFANSKLLLLVWLVPAVGAWWVLAEARREQALARFVSPELQRKLRPPTSRARFRWQAGLMCLGLALGLIAAARPQWGQEEEVVFQRGRDLVAVLDVSRSMLATDVRPNRLERAKADLLDLTKELRGDRAALVAFRRKATLLCPLTTDYAYFTQALEGAAPDSAPAGETDIGEAIRTALKAFESEGGAHKAIILISDGEDLAGGARAAAEAAAKQGIVIFTVGLGSREGAPVPDPDQKSGVAQYHGQPVQSRLDNKTLHEIASLTHGAYVPVETASMTTTTLGVLYRDHLRNITEQDIEERRQLHYVDRFQWFLGPAFLAMLAAAALSRGRLAARHAPVETSPGPPPVVKAAALALLLGATLAVRPAAAQSTNAPGNLNVGPPTAPAGATLDESAPAPDTVASTNAAPADVAPGRAGARQAQRLFERGKYAEAAQAYLAAARGATADSQQDYRYNAAVSLYRAKDFTGAAALLRELESARAPARIPAGLGAAAYQAAAAPAKDAQALQRQSQLTREAADAFRRAARGAPDDAESRHNAAVAVAALGEREDAAHIADVLQRHQGADAGKLASEMLMSQREIDAAIAASATNESPSRIAELEALSKRQRETADLWIPLKGKLLEAPIPAGTNGPANAAQLAQVIELTRERMLNTAQQLRDLDPAAGQNVAVTEATIYGLWKATAPYADVLREDIWRQTNAIKVAAMPETPQARAVAEQAEAQALTELFEKRFQQQVPEQKGDLGIGPTASALAASAQTNAPAENVVTNRAQILELTHQASQAQAAAHSSLGSGDLPGAQGQQALSYKILKEIEALLPKSQSPQQQQQQQQDQQQSSQPKDSHGQKDQQQQKQQQQPKPQPSPDQQQQQPKPEPDKQKESEQQQQKDNVPADAQRMMERALQRERDHETEQRRRQSVPSQPSEKDW